MRFLWVDLNPGFPRGYLFKWFALGADPKKENKTNKQKNPKEVHNFSLILSVNISDEYEAREPRNSFRSFICIWKAHFWHFNQSVGAINLHIVLQEAVFLLDFPSLFVLLRKLIHVISIWNPVAFHCAGTKRPPSVTGSLVYSIACQQHLKGWGSEQPGPLGPWSYTWKMPWHRSACGVLPNRPLWWAMLVIWFITCFPMLYFAVKGTFEQRFVRCHQFHFRILLSKKAVLET